jgi:thiol-disulfide isomerase/thioredoxin
MGQARTNEPVRRTQLIVLALVAAVGIALFWQFARAVTDGVARHRASELAVIAPDLEIRDARRAEPIAEFVLPDRFGKPVALSRFAEVDLLLINIWSSGCQVCREEVPELTELDRRLGSIGRAALITIAVEQRWEDVASYFPQGTDLRILFDPDDRVARGVFGTKAYPETFVLDKERRVRARFDGKRPWHSDLMLDYFASFI